MAHSLEVGWRMGQLFSPVSEGDQVDGLMGECQSQHAHDAHDHDHEDDPTRVALQAWGMHAQG